MPDHAFLSASSSHRWLECPPSAKLCAEHPGRGSPFAQQGTDAHTLAAYKLEKALGRKPKDPTEDLNWFDAEMADCTDAYADFVMEQLAEAKEHCPDPLVQVEQKVSFSRWVPEGYGTADACIIADGTMYVIDLKYGTGVLVDADWNPQIMCYALGLLEAYDGIYDIQKIRMTIFQPRRENVTTFGLTKEQLLDWAENSLAPRAQLAWNGEGDFRAGSHCQFCTVKAICRKRAEYNLEMARYDFEMGDHRNNSNDSRSIGPLDRNMILGTIPKESNQYAFPGTITGFSWVRNINIEQYREEEGSGWELPEGATLTGQKEEIHHYNQILDHYEDKEVEKSREVLDHYETQYTLEDNGDGTFTQKSQETPVYRTEYYTETESQPVYLEEPVYRTKFYYTIQKWAPGRDVTVSGEDHTPYWPEYTLAADEREGKRSEIYRFFITTENKILAYSTDFDCWSVLAKDKLFYLLRSNSSDKLFITDSFFTNLGTIIREK